MSDEEIDKAVKEAAEYEAQDKKRKEAVDTRNDADAFAVQTRKALDEVGDKLDAGDKSAVEADLKAVEDLVNKFQKPEDMSDADVSELKNAKEKLEQSAQKVFSKMYENAQAAGAAQGGPQAGPNPGAGAGPQPNAGSTNNSGNNGDDVVDADFKEV